MIPAALADKAAKAGRGPIKEHMYYYYRTPLLSDERTAILLDDLQAAVPGITGIKTEKIFTIASNKRLSNTQKRRLHWILKNRHRPRSLADQPFLSGDNVVEINPRLAFETPDSTNAVSICKKIGLESITRLEQGRRFKIESNRQLSDDEWSSITRLLYDPMVEAVYDERISTFEIPKEVEPIIYIPVLEKGVEALRAAKKEYGLAMDEFDMNYYAWLIQKFKIRLTLEALKDLDNCNSEHSRHHVFRAKIIIDGEEMPFTLMELIKATLKNKENSIIAFHDNASAILGFVVGDLVPSRPGMPSPVRMAEILYHFVLTCETHNHPCLWAAYPGSATGRGGRYRDNQAVGRGGISTGGIAGFMGGNLNDPRRPLPWESAHFRYDPNTESPLEFFIQATKGAFDDGNEAGEPLLDLFYETFGLQVGNERWENIKPIMFSGGSGLIRQEHAEKNSPQAGWIYVRFGGLAYPIGEGGAAGSSLMAGEQDAERDYDSVQRANGEMAKKTDMVVYLCIAKGKDNPFEIITDQGGGGFLNAFKELIFPAGAKINIRLIPVGDQSISRKGILVAEWQESLHAIIKAERWEEFKAICEREDVPVSALGTITGDGKVVVVDGKTKILDYPLEPVLGSFPQKTFTDIRRKLSLEPLKLPGTLTVEEAYADSCKHLAFGSMEWATAMADDSVGGRVVQAKRVGPLQLPVADYAITASGVFEHAGEVNSVSQRQTIGLISPEAMARVVGAEALLKLMFVKVTKREDVKSSANWMLAAKVPGGIAWLYDAAKALEDLFSRIGIDIDGGKDSLSLAAKVGKELVKSLGTLVITTYVGTKDFRVRITPDLKKPGRSKLLFVDLAQGKTRLGGSILAQTQKQVGNECPDVDNPESVTEVFDLMQELLQEGVLLAGHAKGRGGLAKTLSQMAFAGNCGINVDLKHKSASVLEMLFNEELGFVVECLPQHEERIKQRFAEIGLGRAIHSIGDTSIGKRVSISFNGKTALDKDMRYLRDVWRDTSYFMNLRLMTKSSADMERENLYDQKKPPYKLTFNPDLYPADHASERFGRPRVAVIRCEGANSYREAWMALWLSGFEPWEVHVNDFLSGRISLKNFRGIVFPGGFTYKDVLGSAVGWAAVMKFNPMLARELSEFLARPDTFSIGVCNGCQLMAILGIAPWKTHDRFQPALYCNSSERFESRFPSVMILDSPAIATKEMEGSILGVRSAHGEGRIYVPTPGVMRRILNERLAPIRFVDDMGEITERYPFNPNGSPFGITALCDRTGRHLMFMEHPERTILRWHWGWWPEEWSSIQNSPWLRMFQNMYQWCLSTEDFSEKPLLLAA